MKNINLMLLAIALGCAFVQSIPLTTGPQCSSQQCSEPVNVVFKVGKSYLYEYETESAASFNGAKTNFGYKAHVTITRINKCEYQMKLSHVEIRKLTDVGKYVKALEAEPLRFEMNDGTVTLVCSGDNEPEWVLNMKKSILSLIQITPRNIGGVTSLREVDVLGNCDTQYDVIAKSFREGTTITKMKDLKSCSNRYQSPLAPIQLKLNNIEPRILCTQVLGLKGVISSVSCEESMQFNNTLGYRRELDHRVRTSLKLKETKEAEPKKDLPTYRKDSLLYRRNERQEVTLEEFKKLVQDFTSSSDQYLTIEAPKKLQRIARKVEHVSFETLKSAWQWVSTEKPQASKGLIEAIESTPSASSLRMMSEVLLPGGYVSEKSMEDFLVSIALRRIVPTHEMMKNAIDYLKSQKVPRSGLFGLTALAQAHANENHDNDKLVEQFQKVYQEKMNSASQQDMIYYVRALSNLHVLNKDLHQVLLKKSQSGPVNVRLASLDALRRSSSCEENVRNQLKSMFKSSQEPIEIKVAAYKAWVECIKQNEIIELFEFVERGSDKESSIRNFILQHMKNARSSDNPDKNNLKEAIIIAGDLPSYMRSVSSIDSHSYKGSKHLEKSFKISNEVKLVVELESSIERDELAASNAVLNISLPYNGENANLIELGVLQSGYDELIGEIKQRLINLRYDNILQKLYREKNLNSVHREVSKTLEGLPKPKPDANVQIYVAIGGNVVYYLDSREINTNEPALVVDVMRKSSPLQLIFKDQQVALLGGQRKSLIMSNGLVFATKQSLTAISQASIGEMIKKVGEQGANRNYGLMFQAVFELKRRMSAEFGGEGEIESVFVETLSGGSSLSTSATLKSEHNNDNKDQELHISTPEKNNILTLDYSMKWHDYGKKETPLGDLPNNPPRNHEECKRLATTALRLCTSERHAGNSHGLSIDLVNDAKDNEASLVLKRKVKVENLERSAEYTISGHYVTAQRKEVIIRRKTKLPKTNLLKDRNPTEFDYNDKLEIILNGEPYELETAIVHTPSKSYATLTYSRGKKIAGTVQVHSNGRLREQGKKQLVIKVGDNRKINEYQVNILARKNNDETVYNIESIEAETGSKLFKAEAQLAGVPLPTLSQSKDFKMKINLQAGNPSLPAYTITNLAFTKGKQMSLDVQNEYKTHRQTKPVKTTLIGSVTDIKENGKEKEYKAKIDYKCNTHKNHNFVVDVKYSGKGKELMNAEIDYERPELKEKRRYVWSVKQTGSSDVRPVEFQREHLMTYKYNNEPEAKLVLNCSVNEKTHKYQLDYDYNNPSPTATIKVLKGHVKRETLSPLPNLSTVALVSFTANRFSFNYQNELKTVSPGNYKSNVVLDVGDKAPFKVETLLHNTPEKRGFVFELVTPNKKTMKGRFLVHSRNNHPEKIDSVLLADGEELFELQADKEHGSFVLKNYHVNVNAGAWKRNGTALLEIGSPRYGHKIHNLLELRRGVFNLASSAEHGNKKSYELKLKLNRRDQHLNVAFDVPVTGYNLDLEAGQKKVLLEVGAKRHGFAHKSEFSLRDGPKFWTETKVKGEMILAIGYGKQLLQQKKKSLTEARLQLRNYVNFDYLNDHVYGQKLTLRYNASVLIGNIQFQLTRNKIMSETKVTNNLETIQSLIESNFDLLYKRGDSRLIKYNVQNLPQQGKVNGLVTINGKSILAISGKWSQGKPLVIDIDSYIKATIKRTYNGPRINYEVTAADNNKLNTIVVKIEIPAALREGSDKKVSIDLKTDKYGNLIWEAEKKCTGGQTSKCDYKRKVMYESKTGSKFEAEGEGQVTLEQRNRYWKGLKHLKSKGTVSVSKSGKLIGKVNFDKEVEKIPGQIKITFNNQLNVPNSPVDGVNWNSQLTIKRNQYSLNAVRKQNGQTTATINFSCDHSNRQLKRELSVKSGDVDGTFKMLATLRSFEMSGRVDKAGKKYVNFDVNLKKINVDDFIPTNGNVVVNIPNGKIVYNSPNAKKADLKVTFGPYEYDLSVGEEKRQRSTRAIHPLLIKSQLKDTGSKKELMTMTIYVDDNWGTVDLDSVLIILRAKIDQIAGEKRTVNANLCLKTKGCFNIDTQRSLRPDEFDLHVKIGTETLDKTKKSIATHVTCIHKPEHQQKRVIFELNGARLGFDCDKKRSDTGLTHQASLFLPQRVLRFHGEAIKRQAKLQFWLNAEKSPDQVLTLNIEQLDPTTGQYKATMTHPVLKKPVVINGKVTAGSGHFELNFSEDSKEDYIFDFESKRSGETLNGRMALQTRDKRLFFEKINQSKFTKLNDSSVEVEADETFNYHDHDGKLKSYKRSMKVIINENREKKSRNVEMKGNLEHPLIPTEFTSYAHYTRFLGEISTTFIMEQGKRLITNVKYDLMKPIKCVDIDIKLDPNPTDGKTHTIKICYNRLASSKDDTFKLTVSSVGKDNKPNEELLFTTRRVESTPADYLISIVWSPNLLITSMDAYSDMARKYQSRYQALKIEGQKNRQLYSQIIGNGIGDKVVGPLASRLYGQLTEMKHELIGSLKRGKREVAFKTPARSELSETLRRYENLYNVKFLVYNPDENEIKFIVRDFTLRENLKRIAKLKYELVNFHHHEI